MEDVEELFGRVLMIYQGRRVLYGSLPEIKARYRDNAILVEFDGRVGHLAGVSRRIDRGPASVELILEPGADVQTILRQLVDSGVAVTRFDLATPSLNDIFIRVAEAGTTRQ